MWRKSAPGATTQVDGDARFSPSPHPDENNSIPILQRCWILLALLRWQDNSDNHALIFFSEEGRCVDSWSFQPGNRVSPVIKRAPRSYVKYDHAHWINTISRLRNPMRKKIWMKSQASQAMKPET